MGTFIVISQRKQKNSREAPLNAEIIHSVAEYSLGRRVLYVWNGPSVNILGASSALA